MENTGWVKLYMKITEWEWYDDHNTTRLFIHLLLTVNHEDVKWRGLIIKRGQRVSSIAKLAMECGISAQSVRTSIKRLKSTCDLTQESHSDFSLFELKNYNDYQETNKPANKVPTKSQQSPNNNIRMKRMKRMKEEKNKEDIFIYDGELRPPTPSENMKQFLQSVQSRDASYQDLIFSISEKWKMPSDVISCEIDKFVNYWGELNKSGQKQRWETEKTFEVQRRLATWLVNSQKYSKTNQTILSV
jgi:hypothetical protein